MVVVSVGLTSTYLYLQHDDDAGTFALGAPNLPDVAIPLTRDGLESALSVQYTYPLMQSEPLEELSLQDAALRVEEQEYQAREIQERAMVSVAALYVQWWVLSEQNKFLFGESASRKRTVAWLVKDSVPVLPSVLMFCVLSRLWDEREAVLLNVDGVPRALWPSFKLFWA